VNVNNNPIIEKDIIRTLEYPFPYFHNPEIPVKRKKGKYNAPANRTLK
jgi:hypothetical protein